MQNEAFSQQQVIILYMYVHTQLSLLRLRNYTRIFDYSGCLCPSHCSTLFYFTYILF